LKISDKPGISLDYQSLFGANLCHQKDKLKRTDIPVFIIIDILEFVNIIIAIRLAGVG
jgi:hypothetical protein